MTIFIPTVILMSWNMGESFDKHDSDPDINQARKKRIRYLHFRQEDNTVILIPYTDEKGEQP